MTQIYRILLGIGIFRGILLCIVFIPFIVLFLHQQLQKTDHTHYWVTAIFVGGLILIHQKRKDHYFLLKISDSVLRTYSIEYFFFSLPVIALFAFSSRFSDLFIYLVSLRIILFIPPSDSKASSTFATITHFIPDYIFEWKAGIRRYIYFILPIYVIGISGALLNIWVSIACAILLSTILWSFNSVCESREMLEAGQSNPKKFLANKLKQHLTYWCIFILPILISACINYEHCIYSFLAFLILTNSYVCSILLKYAYFTPNMLSVTGGLVGNIVLLLSVIPVISVLMIICNILLHRKAVNKLNDYLNDYN